MTRGYTPEEAVIGSLVTDSQYSLPKLKGILNPEHFKDYSLSQVYEIALGLEKSKQPIDIITMISRLSSGYSPTLIEICEKFPGTANLEAYRDQVIRDYHERKLKEHMAIGSQNPDRDVIEKIQNEWKGIQSLGAKKFDLTEKVMAYTDTLEKRGKGGETLYPTGFPILDFKVPLLKRGEMCIVGARTSMGKTALLLSLMLKMAHSGLRIVFVSGEMSFNQMMDRIISHETMIPLMDLRKGSLKKADWPRITNSLGVFTDSLKIRFVEASKLSFDRIMPHVIEYKPDALFIDYIQRFSSDAKQETRASFYSDVANNLKGLAVERNIVVVAASQLGRGVEHRKDDPKVSDLKESGGLEEAADVVWCLHSDKSQISGSNIDYKMLILKNRNGPTFSFEAVFKQEYARFYEKEKEEYHD